MQTKTLLQNGHERPTRRVAQTTVVDLIKEYIVAQRLRPGDPMPTETELCAELGASRSSVREAVKVLSALDIVDVRHGFGTFVGTLSLRALVDSLAFRGFLDSGDDRKVMLDLVEIRQLLEQGMADQVIATMDAGLAERLREVTDAMRVRSDAGEDFLDEDREFHAVLMERLDNALVAQFTGAFWEVHTLAAPALGPSPVDRTSTVQAHVDILDSAVAGDVAALRLAIARHYDPIRDRLAARLEPTDGGSIPA